jgi:hypothetical protein
MGPGRNFLVARNNPSTSSTPAGALTGFKRFPGFRDPALNPNHESSKTPTRHLQPLPGVFGWELNNEKVTVLRLYLGFRII